VLLVLIPTVWLLIMALFVAVCHTAARGDAVPAVQFEAGTQAPVRLQRRRARLHWAGARSRASDRRAPVARSEAR
jgi:hypothetical protein